MARALILIFIGIICLAALLIITHRKGKPEAGKAPEVVPPTPPRSLESPVTLTTFVTPRFPFESVDPFNVWQTREITRVPISPEAPITNPADLRELRRQVQAANAQIQLELNQGLEALRRNTEELSRTTSAVSRNTTSTDPFFRALRTMARTRVSQAIPPPAVHEIAPDVPKPPAQPPAWYEHLMEDDEEDSV